MAMLEVKNIGISFGGLKAVDNFSLTIEKGQLYGLIGPNGAGKTTIFNLLTGVYKADHGAIFLDGKELTGKSTIEINQAVIHYLDWRSFGLLFSFPFLAFQSFLVGITTTKALSVAAIMAICINIPFNYLPTDMPD